MESATIRNLKPEWWGSPLVQEEKYQEKPVKTKVVVVVVAIVIVIVVVVVIIMPLICFITKHLFYTLLKVVWQAVQCT
jgi:hypothetical protein